MAWPFSTNFYAYIIVLSDYHWMEKYGIYPFKLKGDFLEFFFLFTFPTLKNYILSYKDSDRQKNFVLLHPVLSKSFRPTYSAHLICWTIRQTVFSLG